MIRIRSHKVRPEGKRNRSVPHWLRFFRQAAAPTWRVAAPETDRHAPLWEPVGSPLGQAGSGIPGSRLVSWLVEQLPLIILLIAGLFTMPQIMPAPVITYEGIFDNTNPENVQMDVSATNNNTGSIYNSADLNLTSLLAYNPDATINSIWEIGTNSTDYASIADMVSNWNVAISGEVQNGWN